MAERDALLRAVQAARTGDKLAIAVAALDAHDRRRTASLQRSRETDMSATAVRATLEPLPAFERHTAATDWLGEYEAPSDYRTAMIAEASKWYRGIPRDLMADPDEFNEQALGHAYTAASAYGPHALAARREFMTYVGYLTRSGASGLPQIQQTEDPKDNPAATPLPPETFDNFAPEQNEYNGGAESPNGQSAISSEQAPMIQQVQQMDGSGSGFGSGPERPDEHSTAMDTADSYAEVPLGPPGQIPTAPPGAAPPAPSAPNPAMGQNMDAGAEQRPTAERQASLSVAAYTRPDQDGFRWHIGSDQDVDTLDTPYHERCGSLHWPEQDCSHGNAHTASVAVGYLMSVEDFHRRAYFESQGSAEGTATLRAAGGNLRRVASHHTALTAAFSAEARTEDEIAWLHGYLARVRPVLAGGKDPFGGKAAQPFGADVDDGEAGDGKKKRKKKKGKPWDKTGGVPPGRLPNFPEPRQGQLRKGAPFAGYEDFAACVAANSDKNDPEAYCGKIKHQVEGAQRTAQTEEDQPRHQWDEYADQLHRDQPPPEPAAYDRQHEGSRRTAQERPFSTEPGGGGGWGDDNEDLWEPHVRPHMRPSFRELWQIDPDAGERQPTDEDRTRFERHVRSRYPADVADAYFHQHQGTRKTAGAKCDCGEEADGTCTVCDKPVCDEHSTKHDHDRFCRKHAGSHEAASQLPQVQQTVDPNNVPTPQADQLPTDVMFPLNPAFGGEGGDEDEGKKGKQAARSSMTPSMHAVRMFGQMDAMDGKAPYHKSNYAFSNQAHGQYIRGYAATRGVLDGYSDRDAMDKNVFHDKTGRGDLHGHYLDAFNEARSRKSGGTQATGSLRRQADFMTKPHASTDDGSPPFNTAQTSPEPWSSNEGSGDYSQGVKDGQEDAAAGEHPTFSDNSSRVSPYVQGYSVGYSGRPPDAGQQDVPRSVGGDSGQAGNAADAQRAFQVSHASLQRTAACIGCGHLPHLGQPCTEKYCTDKHNEGEMGSGSGTVKIPPSMEKDPSSYMVRPKTMWQEGSLRVSAAFVTPEATREPDFRKGYKYAARWQPGMLLVQQGSPAFEAGLYAGVADRPGGVQEAWAGEHYRLSRKFPVLGARLDAHSGFTVKFARVNPRRYGISASGYLVPVTAATSTDLITDGPGASPDPMGNTPLNGPGQPPPMGGGEDPARSGGVPPYQGASPPASAPVAPDDVLGQPQEPPQPGGPFTQTFSGRHPGNADLAPAAPNTAGGGGYSNTDATQGDPMHKPQAMAFRRRVQAGLAARRAS